MIQNEFDNEVKYKLFRNVREILHPTISKKNISDYKITIDEDILPVRVFYPEKVSELKNVILFLHGNGIITDCLGKYSEICKRIAKETNQLLIAIDYKETKKNYIKNLEEIDNTIKFLYKELQRNEIEKENITLMGDSTGCNLIVGINQKNSTDILISKEIFFYPIISLNYKDKEQYESFQKNKDFNRKLLENLECYSNIISYKKDFNTPMINPFINKDLEIPKTLIITGNVDSLKDEAKKYYELKSDNIIYQEIPFAIHGFLKEMDEEMKKEVFMEINDFLK